MSLIKGERGGTQTLRSLYAGLVTPKSPEASACSSVCVCACCHISCVQLFGTPWTVARQGPLSTGFSRQEYWSGLPCPPPGDLPNPGIESTCLKSPALAGGFLTTSTTWEAPLVYSRCFVNAWCLDEWNSPPLWPGSGRGHHTLACNHPGRSPGNTTRLPSFSISASGSTSLDLHSVHRGPSKHQVWDLRTQIVNPLIKESPN